MSSCLCQLGQLKKQPRKKLKSPESKWTKIPIFVVSNTASSENLQSYIRLGVDKYSVKSDHRLDEIAGEIKSFLDKQEK